ncbi:MAG: hypothetical protein JO261_00540 [Alphaproteobacteria bacterium]|nr:hypothetical protein [Alphaproteobacteria bacterium]MBV9692162.1 hypothetical protein [Alphaproteobacteria bacterium]
MMDQPSMRELVEAVRDFIEQKAMPELKGHTAFHARVAANALGIVARELAQGPQSAADERERLAVLLGHDGTLEELNRELCRRIRDGAFSLDTPGLAEHLTVTTREKVLIDQPNYAGLKRR